MRASSPSLPTWLWTAGPWSGWNKSSIDRGCVPCIVTLHPIPPSYGQTPPRTQPSIRRKGVGAKILRECERVVSGWGFKELWLVVDEKNKPARALYERCGYELMGREPRGVKVVPTEWQLREVPVTNLCMRKDLSKAGAGLGGGALIGGLFGGLFGAGR